MPALRLAAYAAIVAVALTAVPVVAASPASDRPDPAERIVAQRKAMEELESMDGVWRGRAWSMLPSGKKHMITQTERIGLFLEGSIRVIEGCGYEDDGTVGFHALGIVSYDPDKKLYSMRSYVRGSSGDFLLTPTGDGFTWEVPIGPGTIRYTATIDDDTWHEVGERIVAGRDPMRIFEMNLRRVGDTDWPAAGAIPPR